jgi:WD40 repeat protein
MKIDGPDAGAAPWEVVWASGTDDDPRMVRRWRIGPVRTVAWSADSGLPLVAAGVPSGIRVWDIDGGTLWTAAGEPLCLAFAGPTLVSGHTDGLRIWDAATGAPIGQVTDIGQVHQLIVVDTPDGPQALTRNGRDRVQRWWLPSGRPVDGPALPAAHAIAAGRLGDGRLVLLAGLDGLALRDLGSDEQTWVVEPPGLNRIRAVALSTGTGRDLATIVGDKGQIQTLDVRTGVPLAEAIPPPDGRHEQARRPRIAVVGGVLAVSDRWRVRLYDPATSRPAGPPLPGPVAAATVAAAGNLLLTSSEEDQTVALWDLSRSPGQEPGHDERVVGIALAGAGVVVSADAGGTLLVRDAADGRLLHPPTRTAVLNTRSVTAWTEGPAIVAATGAGERDFPDPFVRLLNLTTGEPLRPPIDTRQRLVRHLASAGPMLITRDGPLRAWRIADGALLDERIPVARSGPTGFGVGSRAGRIVVATSTYRDPLEIQDLSDPDADPVLVPDAGDGRILAVSGPYIVTRGRVLDTTGRTIAAGIRRLADATLAAVRVWPQAYLAHEDGTITLTDLLTGDDLAPPTLLPSPAIGLATTADGGLLVGYGSDVARLNPPLVSLPGVGKAR